MQHKLDFAKSHSSDEIPQTISKVARLKIKSSFQDSRNNSDTDVARVETQDMPST